MNEYKSVAKFKKKHHQGTNSKIPIGWKKFFLHFVSRVLIVVILFLITLIVMKVNPKFKTWVTENVYHTSFQFAEVKQFYNKYIGSVLPFGDQLDDKPVFQEQFTYQEANVYLDGASVKVGKNYLVPSLESGIVVYIGEKKEYGNTLVVQQVNGIDVWYANVQLVDLKLYDYIEKGTLLGEAKEENIYLVFQKDGKFLDYKDYLA